MPSPKGPNLGLGYYLTYFSPIISGAASPPFIAVDVYARVIVAFLVIGAVEIVWKADDVVAGISLFVYIIVEPVRLKQFFDFPPSLSRLYRMLNFSLTCSLALSFFTLWNFPFYGENTRLLGSNVDVDANWFRFFISRKEVTAFVEVPGRKTWLCMVARVVS